MLGVAGIRGDSLRAKEMAANKTMPVYLLSVRMRFILISTPVAPTPHVPPPSITVSLSISSQHAISPHPRLNVFVRPKGLLLPFSLRRFYRERIKPDTFRTCDRSNYCIVANETRFVVRRNRRVVTSRVRFNAENYPSVSLDRFASPRVVNNNSFSLRESTWKREWTP